METAPVKLQLGSVRVEVDKPKPAPKPEKT